MRLCTVSEGPSPPLCGLAPLLDPEKQAQARGGEADSRSKASQEAHLKRGKSLQ